MRANNYGQIFTKPVNLLPACIQTPEKADRLDELLWQWLRIPCHHLSRSLDTAENGPSRQVAQLVLQVAHKLHSIRSSHAI